jgi:hypothetical protein
MSSNHLPRAVLLSVALGLTACGGGGSGGAGSGTPAAASLQAAAIVTQPAPQSAPSGSAANFSVNASGSGLTYQWRRDGKDIAGATSASYTLNNVQPDDDGAVFTVEVKNGAGSVVSAGAALQVTVPKGLSLFAGRLGGPGNLDGQDGRLRVAYAVGASPSGLIYVTDSPTWFGEAGTLRTIDPATGVVTTVQQFSQQEAIQDIEFDAAGNRYDLLRRVIYKTTPGGVRTLFAGDAAQSEPTVLSSEAMDGVGAAARFATAVDMAIDANGNLYVADGYRIRKVDPAGKVVTLAGSFLYSTSSVDGVGSMAGFQNPRRLTVDRAGNVFVVDGSNVYGAPPKLRKVTPDGKVTTVALKSADAGGADLSTDSYNGAIAADAAGNLYVTDNHHGCRIRRIDPNGTITDLAGSAATGYADGKGAAARFCGTGVAFPSLTTDKAGNLIAVDSANYAIRRVTLDGNVSTVGGRPPSTDNQDGKGGTATFVYTRPNSPYANPGFAPGSYELAVDAQGTVYVGEGDRVRKVTSSRNVTTLPSAPGASANARYFVGGLAYGDSGILLSNNVISRIDANGALRFVAGKPLDNQPQLDGAGANAVFQNPYDVIMDGLGNIFLHDLTRIDNDGFWHFTERRVTRDGVVSMLPVNAVNRSPAQWHAAKDGMLWVANSTADVYVQRPDGTATVVRKAPAGLDAYPTAITRDAAGNLYLATKESAKPADERGTWYMLRKIAPDGTETVVAGTAGSVGVRLGSPGSLGWVDALAVGPDGIVYVMTENAVLKLKP